MPAASPQATAAQKPKTTEVDDVSWIDELVQERWKDSSIKPSPPASDGEFVRRAYLDIIGRIPSAKEARDYIDSREKDKKARLITKLLGAEEYGKFWATIWSNLLIGRNPQRDIDRASMNKYLRDSFAENKPWNKLVYELVTATGGSTPKSTAEGIPYNGATNFMLSHMNDGKVPATSFTTRLFLGMQVQCTQCHDHPFNDRKQESFWGVNAFLQKVAKQDYNDTSDTGQRIFLFSDLRDEPLEEGSDIFVRYDKRNAFVEVTPPLWIDGSKILEPSADLNLRQRLGELITSPDNEYFPKAIVNRMWAHFLGRGIVHPMDDLGEHNEPSNPDLIDKLANHFKESNYDLKRLITWITMSAPYSLSSQTTSTNKEDDSLFSHFSLKQMSPEQFFDSLMIASRANEVGANKDWERAEQMKDQLLRQFTQVFNNDENLEADSFNGTIPQALLLMNGDIMSRAVSVETGSFLRQRVDAIMEAQKKSKGKARSADANLLNDLYLAAVSRYPTGREKTLANQVFMATLNGSANTKNQDVMQIQLQAYQDIFWALLNSSEFVLNH
jgi:hypothetical protein